MIVFENGGKMTKEILEKKLAELRASRDQILANLYATQGAIQLCEQFITELLTSEEKEVK